MDRIKTGLSYLKNKVTNAFDGNDSTINHSDTECSISDPSMSIGDLYNAPENSILGKLNEVPQSKRESMNRKTIVTVYRKDQIKVENLLQILQIDDETRLAIALQIIKPHGILSIVNYSYLIDDFTRLIYYSEGIDEQSLIYDSREKKHLPKSATHLITKMKFGISFVILLQLSPDGSSSIEQIDNDLENFTSYLESDLPIADVIPNEKTLRKHIHINKIYSNVTDLCTYNDLREIHTQLQKLRQHSDKYRPLTMTMTSLSSHNSSKNPSIPINRQNTISIETMMLPLASNIQIFRKELKHFQSSLLKDHLPRILENAKRIFTEFHELYLHHLNTLRTSIIQIRYGQISQETFAQLFNTEEEKALVKKMHETTRYFDHFKSKDELIADLQSDRIDYLDISNTDINEDDDQQALMNKLIKSDENIRIFCSNDRLRTNERNRWDELIADLIESARYTRNCRLIYADFSYSTYELEELKLISSSKKQKKKKLIGQSKQDSNESESSINIVLFGESGVGKSTFINAFANYLFFENIAQARSEEPYVIIPVSFLMTINDQFEERRIQFGHAHSNENHNDLGQSVTQQCRAYHFTTRDGKTLKIIDTPGFGDTRGQNQDENNLKEVFFLSGKLNTFKCSMYFTQTE